MPQWRPFLGATFACLLVAPAADAGIAADRIGAFHRNQLLFDRSGEPLITVRLQRGRTRLWLESPGPLRWMMRGSQDGVQTPPGRWHIRLASTAPGTRQWWSGVARFAGDNPSRTSAALARWRARGLTARAFETGVLIGLGPVTIDTRTVVLGVRPAGSARSARRFSQRLGARYDTPVGVWQDRPSGWIVAHSKDQAMELRAQDLLAVEPVHPEDSVVVGGVPWRKQRARQRRFGGRIELLVGTDRKLLVLNTAPAELVLEGVVPSEMRPKAPAEALAAQAVAARGQLLARLGTRHRGEPYHVCSSTHCQVYSGRTHATAKTTAAVRATAGRVLVDGGGLTESVYGSACGGHTEAFHLMWGGRRDAVLKGRMDGRRGAAPTTERAAARFIDQPPKAWCAKTGTGAGVFRWRVRRTGAAVTEALAKRAKIGPVRGIKVLKRGRSGRALRVAYIGTRGRHEVRGEHLNRKILGGLKSGLWVVERVGGAADGAPEAWHFRGGGFGHGVGLCQHGAMGMALAGRDHQAILRHYYPGARLESLW